MWVWKPQDTPLCSTSLPRTPGALAGLEKVLGSYPHHACSPHTPPSPYLTCWAQLGVFLCQRPWHAPVVLLRSLRGAGEGVWEQEVTLCPQPVPTEQLVRGKQEP